jgi:putative alpha-1,2-mannosidase
VLNYQTTDNETIEVKTGLSYTSIANAKNNFTAEATGLSFEQAKAKAQQTWEQQLVKLLLKVPMSKTKPSFIQACSMLCWAGV